MDSMIKAKIKKIIKNRLTNSELDELITFFRQTFTDSVTVDEEDPFFKCLAYEMKGEVKELAALFSDFRSELRSKIHPDLTEIATKYIPQASDQLEGIIKTTEMATHKIMDNLEVMQSDIGCTTELLGLLKEGKVSAPDKSGNNGHKHLDENTILTLSPFLGHMETSTQKIQSLISDSFVQMSFQDLTGQRIKKIINLVSQMEERITGMVISFGIKLSEKEKNPRISDADLQKAVDEKVELLAGPQREGEGMDQADIDALLAEL